MYHAIGLYKPACCHRGLYAPPVFRYVFVSLWENGLVSRLEGAVTLSKKESRTKVAKNCMKSLYSQVSVEIFDKVKQSHLSVSQSQLKLGEKSPKKKP